MVRSVLQGVDAVVMRLKATSRSAREALRPFFATIALLAEALLAPLAWLGISPRLGGVAVMAAAAAAGLFALVWGANTVLSGVLSPDATARALMVEARAERERESDAMTHALVLRQQQTLEVGRGESLAL